MHAAWLFSHCYNIACNLAESNPTIAEGRRQSRQYIDGCIAPNGITTHARPLQLHWLFLAGENLNSAGSISQYKHKQKSAM